MSVFEVVFAAMIMFVVLTAVLGLVATSTSMGIDAKQRNLLSNTIASRMEYVRGLPFEQVAIAVSGGTGVLPAKETFTLNGITVTVTYAVRNGTGGTKEVRIAATASVPGRPLVSTSAFSIVRDTSQDMTQFTGVALGPNLRWADSTPRDSSVVYDNLVWNAGYGPDALVLAVEGEPQNTNYTITLVEMYVIGSGTELVYLKDGTAVQSAIAKWEYSPGATSITEAFRWHTKQVYVDAGGNTVVAIPDGWQTVRCRATDNEGRSRSIDRTFFVDNYPPGDSGVPTATVMTDVLASAMWAAGNDATMYNVTQYRQRSYGLGPYTDASSWETSPTVTVSGVMTDVETAAFSRYVMTVLARSPRLNAPNAIASEPYVSRPLATGEARIISYLKTLAAVATLTVTPPTFPCDGSTTYAFSYRQGTAGAWTNLGSKMVSGSSPVTYVSPAVLLTKSGGVWQPIYYRCQATYTPSGYKGGTADQIVSDVAGASPWGALVSIGTTSTLTHAEW